MGTDGHERISLVLPTYNRAGALRANLADMLAIDGVSELIVVDDGSSDDTAEVCAEIADERLRVIRHPRNRGVAAARNTGVEAASGAWVLFGEDDCRFPREYATVLRREGARHDADIVSAPLLHLTGSDADAAALAARTPRRERPPSVDESNVFPARDVHTPFLPARALVRAEVFERVRFYDGFPVNGYREETDFFVQAARAGFRCLLTGATYCYQLDTWDGGQHHSSPLRYEYWALRNNWRFLRRHGAWLREQGYIAGPARAQLGFAVGRGRAVAGGMTRARVARARRAWGGRRTGSDEGEPAAAPSLGARGNGSALDGQEPSRERTRQAVLVSPDVSNAAGGVERMCVLLADVLARGGWRSTIVGPEREAGRWEFRLALGPLVRSRSAMRAARERRPDLLITNGYLGAGCGRGGGGERGGRGGRGGGERRIHVYHGTSVGAVRALRANLTRREAVRHALGYGAAEALAARGAAAVVCVSDAAAAEARRFYRVKNATVIANGIDTDVFSPMPRAQARQQLGLADDGRYALFVGRLDHGKGARLLAPACARTGFQLVVAGPDAGADALNLGVLAPAQLAVAYSAADCVLFPSSYEGCSYVVLEALACGTPLVTTRVGWMPTLLAAVPEYEALCVEPVLEELVARLDELERIDTAPLSAAARAYVIEHNSLGAYAAQWRELLDGCLA